MNKVIYLLAFSLLSGCAGFNARSKIDVVLDNQTTMALVGTGESQNLNKEVQFFVDWWKDMIGNLRAQVKQEENEGDNTILQTKEIVFYDNYKVIIVRIYMKYTNGEANLYAVILNDNHSYSLIGMLPILKTQE